MSSNLADIVMKKMNAISKLIQMSEMSYYNERTDWFNSSTFKAILYT